MMVDYRSSLRIEPGREGAGSPQPGHRAPVARRSLSLDEYVEGVRRADRAILGRAITLIESSSDRDQRLAQELLTRLMPHTGGAHRVGITGIPGAGKSTFIETLGCNLTAAGHRVAVLAVDPSSGRSGGSILGDKMRMSRLAADPNAFIRPSPSAGTLGGVARKTRESMLICEAAGFDIVLVETVGVGQSETVVAGMTDFFLALMIAGGGDELQGIKRGLLELVDMLAINKADGDNRSRAESAAREYANAMHFMTPVDPGWTPPVVTCSAIDNVGIDELWRRIEEHRAIVTASGQLAARRKQQLLQWVWTMLEQQLQAMLTGHEQVGRLRLELEQAVLDGRLAPTLAARQLLEAFLTHPPDPPEVTDDPA